MIIKSSDAEKKVPYLCTGEKVEGVLYQTLATGDKMMITTMFYDEGAHVPEHSHKEEQAGFVVDGKMEIKIKGKTETIAKGDSYMITTNVLHSLIALEKSLVVDTFSPPREDYR